jgi:hypothetical protein
MTNAATKAERTASILAQNRGHIHEWSRLHAIVCMDHGWDANASVALMDMFDGVAIAARLDELNAEIRAELEAKTTSKAKATA